MSEARSFIVLCGEAGGVTHDVAVLRRALPWPGCVHASTMSCGFSFVTRRMALRQNRAARFQPRVGEAGVEDPFELPSDVERGDLEDEHIRVVCMGI